MTAGVIDPESTRELETPSGTIEASVEDPIAQGWRKDKKDRWFVGAKAAGRSGVIYRQGDESVEEAIVRDQEARANGRPPKARPKTTKSPAPTQKTLKELETALTEALEAPAMIAGMKGDKWVADHIYREAPTLSRNLVAAAEHNPKLRARLESMLGGETPFAQIMSQIIIANALIAYAVPPVIYYLGDRAPGRLRETFQVPEKPKGGKTQAERDAEERAAMEAIAQELADAGSAGS